MQLIHFRCKSLHGTVIYDCNTCVYMYVFCPSELFIFMHFDLLFSLSGEWDAVKLPVPCTETQSCTTNAEEFLAPPSTQHKDVSTLWTCDQSIVPRMWQSHGALVGRLQRGPRHEGRSRRSFSLHTKDTNLPFFFQNGLLPRAITLIEGVVLHQPSPLIQPLTTLDAGCCADHMTKEKNTVDQV